MICKNCNKKILNPTYNQIYCCSECREEDYDKKNIQRRKVKGCEICGFWKFIERHHIIKQIDWGSNGSSNLVYLCPNHHKMADSFRYGNEFLKLIKKKTGKCGEKLSNKQIQNVKNYILNELSPKEKYNFLPNDNIENSFLFRFEHRKLIQWGTFYEIALNDKQIKEDLKENKAVSYTHLTLPTTPYV